MHADLIPDVMKSKFYSNLLNVITHILISRWDDIPVDKKTMVQWKIAKKATMFSTEYHVCVLISNHQININMM